uniref:Uncharacterized protein n=1 Tax=Seriola lalandi dorsalis TaxID=1841481 RepID=A0A3B4WHH4_SERLL
ESLPAAQRDSNISCPDKAIYITGYDKLPSPFFQNKMYSFTSAAYLLEYIDLLSVNVNYEQAAVCHRVFLCMWWYKCFTAFRNKNQVEKLKTLAENMKYNIITQLHN